MDKELIGRIDRLLRECTSISDEIYSIDVMLRKLSNISPENWRNCALALVFYGSDEPDTAGKEVIIGDEDLTEGFIGLFTTQLSKTRERLVNRSKEIERQLSFIDKQSLEKGTKT